ncbi:MAG TPA: hypothetical protein VF290_15095, partial [Pyrinomonadaceae bacterium]
SPWHPGGILLSSRVADIANLHGTSPWHPGGILLSSRVADIANLHGTSPWHPGGILLSSGAVQAAQRMIDLRPDSSSYARVSYLRELHGDTEGAIQAMTLALKAANPNDPEGMEWYREQLRLLHAGTKRPHTHRKY